MPTCPIFAGPVTFDESLESLGIFYRIEESVESNGIKWNHRNLENLNGITQNLRIPR